MTFKENIIQIIGKDKYEELEKHANNEVSLALKMHPKNEYGQDNYYEQRFLIEELFEIFELFEKKWIKISPIDIINVLFRCKMLFVVKDENEYRQRVWNVGSIYDESEFAILRNKKSEWIDAITEEYLNRINTFISEKTLIVKLENYVSISDDSELQSFFDNLFESLELPFKAYIDDNFINSEYKRLNPNTKICIWEDVHRYFSNPSIWYSVVWTSLYARRYWYAFLRTFLNILRVSWFINAWQINFWSHGANIMAPTLPVILWSNSRWWLCWHEDKKEPRWRIPDWCLERSFWYRGATKMRIDIRNFSKIKDFFISCKVIFNKLKNPRSQENKLDVYPVLEILSSSTQMSDYWAKVLGIYCCLEHLFVPKNINRDNKKYITGWINALKPWLLDWFEKLHRLRCDYAHKWFIKRDDIVLWFIQESMNNTIFLLKLKTCSMDLNVQ